MSYLSRDFLIELLKLCFKNKDILALCKQYLKYHYLPVNAPQYKEVYKRVFDYHTAKGLIPTIGMIAQSFSGEEDIDKDCLEILARTKEVDAPTIEQAIETLDRYIKESMTVEYYTKNIDKWNKGKRDEVLSSSDEWNKIVNFSLKNVDTSIRLFAGFEDRQIERKLKANSPDLYGKKVIFGIDEIDRKTGGIQEPDDMVGFLAQSNVGKSKLIKYIGVINACRGLPGMHIQAEGSRRECELYFDKTFTGLSRSQLVYDNISLEAKEAINQMLFDVMETYGGEIDIYTYEEFGDVTTLNIRKNVKEYVRAHGEPPKWMTIDYFELIRSGDGRRYSTGTDGRKAELQAVGQQLKNIAVEFQFPIITVSNAVGVSPDFLDNENNVMTRWHCAGDKNMVNPFSYWYTLNQSKVEYANKVMRIFVDKDRHNNKGDSDVERIIKIFTDYDHERFYDGTRTRKEILGEAY